MRQINTEIVHKTKVYRKGGESTYTSIIRLNLWENTKKYRFTYQNGNAFENFDGEIFDPQTNRWNPVFSIDQLGIKSDKSAYNLMDEAQIDARVNTLVNEGMKYIKLLY